MRRLRATAARVAQQVNFPEEREATALSHKLLAKGDTLQLTWEVLDRCRNSPLEVAGQRIAAKDLEVASKFPSQRTSMVITHMSYTMISKLKGHEKADVLSILRMLRCCKKPPAWNMGLFRDG